MAYVGERLAARWSPEQIAGRVSACPPSHLEGLSISHTTIYRWIWSDPERVRRFRPVLRIARKPRRKPYGKHSQKYAQPPLAGAEMWQGTVTSNTIVITSKNKETLTPDEQKHVTEKIRRHIEVFKSDDSMRSYLAQGHLIPLAKYSVPVLRECLTNEDRRIRFRAIETLGKIANTEIAQKNGIERDVSSLDELIAAYDRERDPRIKEMVVSALSNFGGVPSEKQVRIVQRLQKALNHTDKRLRAMGAAVLLGVSPEDGIPEVIDKMTDPAYFGNDQSNILRLLKEATGQDLGTSASEWRAWWQKNKGKIKDD